MAGERYVSVSFPSFSTGPLPPLPPWQNTIQPPCVASGFLFPRSTKLGSRKEEVPVSTPDDASWPGTLTSQLQRLLFCLLEGVWATDLKLENSFILGERIESDPGVWVAGRQHPWPLSCLTQSLLILGPACSAPHREDNCLRIWKPGEAGASLAGSRPKLQAQDETGSLVLPAKPFVLGFLMLHPSNLFPFANLCRGLTQPQSLQFFPLDSFFFK